MGQGSRSRSQLACALVTAMTMGCGGGAVTGASSTQRDAGFVGPADARTHDASTADAQTHAPIPLVDYLGGPIIEAPKVVTITYGADADPTADSNRAFLETFDDDILTTPWWDAVRAGYCDRAIPQRCVGRGTSGGHVHLTDTPAATYDDGPSGGSVRALLQGYIASGALPAPDSDTIYVLFFPSTTTITVDGFAVSCQFFVGYHASFQANPTGGTATVPYIIVPRCSSSADALTSVVSHELIETATDPVDPDPALGGTGYSMTADTVWPVFGDGSEVADLCEWTDGSYGYTEGPYSVVRTWSKLAAESGHDPCVPAPDPATTPYFNVAPSSDKLLLNVGQPLTLELDAFSDGPMSTWTVSVADVSQMFGGTVDAGRSCSTGRRRTRGPNCT